MSRPIARLSRSLSSRLLSASLRGCEIPWIRALAERYGLNRTRYRRQEAVEAVVEAVTAHYAEHRFEAALAARQARVYQKVYFRHRLRRLGPSDPRAAKYRRRVAELGGLGDSMAIIRHLARYYAEDMVAELNPAFFLLFRAVARRIFPHFVRSIRVLEERDGVLDRVRRAVEHGPVFLLPNHVSNADHVPLCFALNAAGIPQPRIAAGANLFRGVSTVVLPAMNAYKIRREQIGAEKRWPHTVRWFQNPVYRRVHTAYLRFGWDRNEPFLFYLEGTRSRDGRLGKPKRGIVADILGYLEHTGRRAWAVPISLSYTLVPEDEEIEAARRGAEISRQDLVSQLTRLDRRYRQLGDPPIHLRFSEPLELVPGEPADRVAARILERIAAGIVPASTSLLARAVLRVARRKGGTSWFRPEEAEAAFRAGPEAERWDEFGDALALFQRRGFVDPDPARSRYVVQNEPLLVQYANRIAHLPESLGR